jgi:hypothetical protein
MDTKGAIIVVILLFVAGFGLFTAIPVIDHNSSVQHNEPTTATILSTDIDQRTNDDDQEYRPVITYEYTVDGERHESENVYPGQFTRWHDSRSTAEDTVSQYTSGQTATVYYDPKNPGNAYLHDTGWPSGKYIGTAAIVISFLGGLYLVWVGFKRWRQRTLIRDTPTEQAQSLSIGPSEITGTAVPTPDGPMPAPFSDEDCVVADYEIKEYDTSGDDSSWDTIDSGVLSCPFFVDDGTGKVLVRPHDDATYDLDPDDWTTTYVDSSVSGPEPVQRFVEYQDDLDYPSDASGQSNDRKYRQNLIRADESVYVFGTVKNRDSAYIPDNPDNADRLVVEKITDDSMQEPMYLISDDTEQNLVSRRRWALWRAPVGGLFVVFGFALILLIVAPLLGIEVPRVFDGIIGSVS